MSFGKLFWGLFFMFDFRLQGFDILSDIIGYWLIFSALSELLVRNDYFRSAKSFSLPLLIMSIFDIYQRPQQGGGLIVGGNPLTAVLGLVLTIVHIIMVYNICTGIAELSREVGNSYLENLSYSRWKFYLTAQVIFVIMIPLGLLAPALIAIAFIPLFILTLASAILLMGLMKAAEKEFPSI